MQKEEEKPGWSCEKIKRHNYGGLGNMRAQEMKKLNRQEKSFKIKSMGLEPNVVTTRYFSLGQLVQGVIKKGE